MSTAKRKNKTHRLKEGQRTARRLSSRGSQRPRNERLGIEYLRHLREIATLLVHVLELAGFEVADISRQVALAARKYRPRGYRPSTSNLGYWARVLARWAEDPLFTSEQGRPLDLPEYGLRCSFSALVGSELPGENPQRCLQTLLATRSVTRLPNGRLRWRSRAAISPQGLNGIEAVRALRALLTNLQPRPERTAERGRVARFTRTVSGFEISQRDAADLRVFVESQGMMFLETVDNWLRRRAEGRKHANASGGRLVRPYVGLIMAADGDLPPFQESTTRRPGPALEFGQRPAALHRESTSI
jgi:hypothetical protein